MARGLTQLLEDFDELQRQISALDYAMLLAYHDGLTVAPPASAEGRGDCMAMLSRFKHDLEAGEATGELLSQLAEHIDELDDLHRNELRVMGKAYREARALPADLLAAYRHEIAVAFPLWRECKNTNDFASFAPHLDIIFSLLRQQAACLDPDREAYDV